MLHHFWNSSFRHYNDLIYMENLLFKSLKLSEYREWLEQIRETHHSLDYTKNEISHIARLKTLSIMWRNQAHKC